MAQPAWLTGPLAVLSMAACGLALAWLLLGANAGALQALSIPALIASGLAALEIGPRLMQGRVRRRAAVIVRTAVAWGAVGLAWPLAHGASALLAGDAPLAAAQLLPAVIGLGVGGGVGAVLGGLVSVLALKRGVA